MPDAAPRGGLLIYCIVYIVFYFICFIDFFSHPSITKTWSSLLLFFPLFSRIHFRILFYLLLSVPFFSPILFRIFFWIHLSQITITFNHFITITLRSLYHTLNIKLHKCTCSEPSSAFISPWKAEGEASSELRPDVAEPAAAPQALGLAHGEQCQQQDDGQNWDLHLVRCV